MKWSIRQSDAESKLCQQVAVELLTELFPVEVVMDILQGNQLWEQRERRLNQLWMIYLLIGWGLYADRALRHAASQLSHIPCLLREGAESQVPVPSALCYRRQQLGSLPLVELMRRVCRPLAQPQTTPDAFRFGLRLMALDGTIETVADTPTLAAGFGRLSGRKGESAYPQVQGVYLLECGTHAIVDALFVPCCSNERHAAHVLLRSLAPGMLLLWDTGFHGFDLFRRARRTGAHVLGRLPAGPSPQKIERLSDGSWLVDIQPGDNKRRRKGERQRLRLIEYTLTDPQVPGYGQQHRLLTTLLDPQQASALEVVCCYHERWEVELGIDELDTHQRALTPVLRSKKPDLVLQELYALVLAHYLIRFWMLRTAVEQRVDPDRLSFTHAVQIIRQFLPTVQVLRVQDWPALKARLCQQMGQVRVPQRLLRINARVVKRKYSPFDLKRPHHRHPPRFPKEFLFRDLVLLI